MHLKLRQEILTKIYQLYDDFLKDYKIACEIKCSACCTRNVSMTALEAYRIVDYLNTEQREDLIEKLKEAFQDKERFHPKITTNQMADMISQGKDLPDEGVEPLWSSCPLLVDKTCSVYENRPFECRAFSSKINCVEEGMADMDSTLMTANNVFKQYIEHIDSFGVSGNMIDMLLQLKEAGNKEIYLAEDEEAAEPMIKNHPAKILMIPPGHQEKIQPVVEEFQKIKIN